MIRLALLLIMSWTISTSSANAVCVFGMGGTCPETAFIGTWKRIVPSDSDISIIISKQGELYLVQRLREGRESERFNVRLNDNKFNIGGMVEIEYKSASDQIFTNSRIGVEQYARVK